MSVNDELDKSNVFKSKNLVCCNIFKSKLHLYKVKLSKLWKGKYLIIFSFLNRNYKGVNDI